MNAVELYLLGRKLTKLAEAAFPSSDLQPSVRTVLVDVSQHPGSSIGEIVRRTGFPQSHVSASVARLRERGVVRCMADTHDARRTLVDLAPGVRERFATRAAIAIDGVLADALAGSQPAVQIEVLRALETVAERLIPRAQSRLRAMSHTAEPPQR